MLLFWMVFFHLFLTSDSARDIVFFLKDTTFFNYLKKRLMLMEETMMVKGKAYTLSFKEL